MKHRYILKGERKPLLPLANPEHVTDRGLRVPDFQDALAEYHFMRSFGMGHARACARVGWHPDSFTRLAQRAGQPITQ